MDCLGPLSQCNEMEVHTYGTASEFEKKQIQKITTGLLRARILAVALNNV